MVINSIVLVIHILSAVLWLSFLPIDFILRKNIRESKNISIQKNQIKLWLNTSNLLGITGMSGILVTGIILVSTSSIYSFFQFSSIHWLATKQVIMVILIIITFAFLIPNAKKLSSEIEKDLEVNSNLDESIIIKMGKVGKILSVMNVLVLVNFLLAVTHKFI